MTTKFQPTPRHLLRTKVRAKFKPAPPSPKKSLLPKEDRKIITATLNAIHPDHIGIGIHQDDLHYLEIGYKHTSNPIFATKAIAHCKKHDKPTPEWAIPTLEIINNNIDNISRNEIDKVNAGYLDSTIAKKLGLEYRRIEALYKKAEERLNAIYYMLIVSTESPNMSVTELAKFAAKDLYKDPAGNNLLDYDEFNYKKSQIYKWFYEYTHPKK